MSIPPRRLANALRALAMDAVEQANSGHPGMPMGMADVATALYADHLKFSADHPHWEDRDRFILSAGHGSMLLYALLHLTGYADLPLEELKKFRQLGARTAGHPEYRHAAGIETTTGPLGQGIANAVGMALAEQRLAAQYGDDLCNHRTWVIAGDGCLMEGISHEAASFAGFMRLRKLAVLFDDNRISIDGATTLTCADDPLARFTAYGWHTDHCDGHDDRDINRALTAARAADRPTLIACRTTIGYGAPAKQGTAAAHGAPLGTAQIAAARTALDWPHPPFHIPADIRAAWRAIGTRHHPTRDQWRQRLAAHPHRAAFAAQLAGDLPRGWDDDWQKWRRHLDDNPPAAKMATRQASGKTLETLAPRLPSLVGGSADLTGSNNTHTGQPILSPQNYGGAYLHYGVREHGMAAIMNGMATHGGLLPYAGTFLAFSDYARPALRLAALMRAHVIHVFTHDSIGLGEDGPTHQPVEHLAALRLIPHFDVYRPCDAAETAECWRQAIARRRPAALALSRQALPPVSGAAAHQTARGAYLLSPADGETQLNLIATGSEIALALQTQRQLATQNIAAAVISAPCLDIFLTQDRATQHQTLPPHLPLLAIEAASPTPWLALAAELGITAVDTVGMTEFGLSAPAAAAFTHFGFTADNCTARAQKLLNA